MALNNITFVKGAGGLGRPLAGEDHISGMVFWLTDANLPSGYGTSDRVKKFFSVADAETQGITEGSATNGVLWYHINEFFRIQPQGVLYVGIYGGVAATVAFTDIELVQAFADGTIRQMGVYNTAAYASAAVTTLQVSCDALAAIHMPLNVIYAADVSGTADLTTLTDLTTLAAKNVSVTVGEDGANVGAALAVSEGNSVTDLGAVLGAVSLSKVSDSIEWIGKFNFTSGTELSVPGTANGDLVKDKTNSYLTTLHSLGYMFMKKQVGLAGTFAQTSATAIIESNDFATIENNRTCDKATRGIRTFMLPNIASPVLVDADGKLSEDTIARFRNDASKALEQMQRDEELSAFEVLIDPTQDTLSTSKVVITIKIVPVGVARQIEINIGFTVAIS